MTEPRGDKYDPQSKDMPKLSHSEGENAMALAAAAGLSLDQWQRDTLTDTMSTIRETWAAPRVGILTPDPNDRERITLVRELYELLLSSNHRIVHTAARSRAVRNAQRNLTQILGEANTLRQAVKRVSFVAGQSRIEMNNGSVIHYAARSGDTIRISKVDLLILDDAELLPDNAYREALPLVAHSGNPQVWMLGNGAYKQVHKHGQVFDAIKHWSQR